jgi:hypothetical protein
MATFSFEKGVWVASEYLPIIECCEAAKSFYDSETQKLREEFQGALQSLREDREKLQDKERSGSETEIVLEAERRKLKRRSEEYSNDVYAWRRRIISANAEELVRLWILRDGTRVFRSVVEGYDLGGVVQKANTREVYVVGNKPFLLRATKEEKRMLTYIGEEMEDFSDREVDLAADFVNGGGIVEEVVERVPAPNGSVNVYEVDVRCVVRKLPTNR